MDDIPVIVRDVAVLVCDEPSILEEALTRVSLDGISYQRLGSRALATQADNAAQIIARFHDVGIYPRVVGEYEAELVSTDESE